MPSSVTLPPAPPITDKWLPDGKFYPNRTFDGATGSPRFIVIHIQQGTSENSYSHFLSASASSTVFVNRDGSIWRLVREEHAPWTNGNQCLPTPTGLRLLNLAGDSSLWSLTIETEGYSYVPNQKNWAIAPTEPQLQSVAWQVLTWMDRYQIPLENVIRHADINSCTDDEYRQHVNPSCTHANGCWGGRIQCPGDVYFDRLIAVLRDHMSSYPQGMDSSLASRWFGNVTVDGVEVRFAEGGPVSALWLGLGHYPRLRAVERYDTRTYFRFHDGTIIWRPNDHADARVLLARDDGDFPEGMDQALARRWFGKVEANGHSYRFGDDDGLRRLWLGLGRSPRIERVERVDQRTYVRFRDGTVAWKPADDAPFRLMGSPGGGELYPDGMDNIRAAAWFGSASVGGQTYAFDEAGTVSALWLRLGRLPSLHRVERYGSRTYFRFVDGSVAWRPDEQTPVRWLGV